MDHAEFMIVDTKLFDRLHWGSIAPLTFKLKSGARVTGQVIAVYRTGAAGACEGAPSGKIHLKGGATLHYDEIADIS